MKKILSNELPLSPLMIFGAAIFGGLLWLDIESPSDPRGAVSDWVRVIANQRRISCSSQLRSQTYTYPLIAVYAYEMAGTTYLGRGYSLNPPIFKTAEMCEASAKRMNGELPAIYVSKSRPQLSVVSITVEDRSNIYWGYSFGALMFVAGVFHVLIRRKKRHAMKT